MSGESLSIEKIWETLNLTAAVFVVITFLALMHRLLFRRGRKPGPVTRGIYDLFLDLVRYGWMAGVLLWMVWQGVVYMR